MAVNRFFIKGCPGWGANPGSFDLIYFLIPSFYRLATSAPKKSVFLGLLIQLIHVYITKQLTKNRIHIFEHFFAYL
jgi:Cys-tRNA synthase (O-phospho-L-seryl-tRNA:Cys-tRNA synthase)